MSESPALYMWSSIRCVMTGMAGRGNLTELVWACVGAGTGIVGEAPWCVH